MKRRSTAPFIVETQEPDGSWREATFELSERLANKRAKEYEESGKRARYTENMNYKPPAPDESLTVEDLLAKLEQRTFDGRCIMVRVYDKRATLKERKAFARFHNIVEPSE